MSLMYLVYLLIVVIIIIVLLKFLLGVLFIAPTGLHEEANIVSSLLHSYHV